MRWGLHTLRSAPLPPRDPTRASATEGPLPGAKAGCHLPQAVSEAAMSDSACKHSDVSPAGPKLQEKRIVTSSPQLAVFLSHEVQHVDLCHAKGPDKELQRLASMSSQVVAPCS